MCARENHGACLLKGSCDRVIRRVMGRTNFPALIGPPGPICQARQAGPGSSINFVQWSSQRGSNLSCQAFQTTCWQGAIQNKGIRGGKVTKGTAKHKSGSRLVLALTQRLVALSGREGRDDGLRLNRKALQCVILEWSPCGLGLMSLKPPPG